MNPFVHPVGRRARSSRKPNPRRHLGRVHSTLSPQTSFLTVDCRSALNPGALSRHVSIVGLMMRDIKLYSRDHFHICNSASLFKIIESSLRSPGEEILCHIKGGKASDLCRRVCPRFKQRLHYVKMALSRRHNQGRTTVSRCKGPNEILSSVAADDGKEFHRKGQLHVHVSTLADQLLNYSIRSNTSALPLHTHELARLSGLSHCYTMLRTSMTFLHTYLLHLHSRHCQASN